MRTCNFAIPIFSLAGNIYRHTNAETLITYWTKEGELGHFFFGGCLGLN